ncbi:hypothetical protein RJT34_16095 [Clitoria ternatea]|uniref:Uncharacterized protein n=1 Tax=Clitoria ternatea TaxID=43366 RepID=A0AAN9J6K6_CLITE
MQRMASISESGTRAPNGLVMFLREEREIIIKVKQEQIPLLTSHAPAPYPQQHNKPLHMPSRIPKPSPL